MEAARKAALAIFDLQNEKMTAALQPSNRDFLHPGKLLNAFAFTALEVSERSTVPPNEINSLLSALSLDSNNRNDAFNRPLEFNAICATPVLNWKGGSFILFQYAALVEALYENPFYWMMPDKSYFAAAMAHRGDFTETFARERLESVFGKSNVHANVDIIEAKGKKHGEM
jgi:hypothetical protein